MKILKVIIILFILVLPMRSLSAGLQVSPARLDISVLAGQEISKNLVIANPTADVQIFEVSADNYTDNIILLPKSFTLESGERKTISVKILSQGILSEANQKIITNISVIAKSLTKNELTVNTGAKIPVEITVDELSKNNKKNLFPIILATILGLLLFFTVKKRGEQT